MGQHRSDIIVAGGGIAGLTATAAFAHAGYDTICVEPRNLEVTAPKADTDLRSTAFLQPALDFLDEIGLWPRLAGHATDLKTMRLMDAGGMDNHIRTDAPFRADAIGSDRFGVNLPNWLLAREIKAHIDTLANAQILSGRKVTQAVPRTREACLTLDDRTTLRAPLIIAADGRDSFLRQNAGIGAQRWQYGQKAVVCAVSHAYPHDNISTEIHRSGGPFTLVPLPDRDGTHCSALVWMETGPKAQALFNMSADAFNTALNARSCDVLGTLALIGDRAIWPIISQIADRMHGPRLALIAEAAHVVPPIGAQGLNMSLADIATLRDLVIGAADPGDRTVLDRYHRRRHPETAARVAGLHALNKMAMAESPSMRDLRNLGLRALHGGPLQKPLMRLGLGSS